MKDLTDVFIAGTKQPEFRLPIKLLNELNKEKTKDTTAFILTLKVEEWKTKMDIFT